MSPTMSSSGVFGIKHFFIIFSRFLGFDLTWWVSQWRVEHREVDQGIGGQEEVRDDGGNYVQLRCNMKTTGS